MEKKEYRKSMKALRDGLSNEIGAVSIAVCEKIVSTDLYKAAKNVFVYAAIGSEISLDELVKKAYEDGKHVFYPVTKGKNMDFYEVFPSEGLKEGAFNVPEPDISEKEAASLMGALMLVPGVAFDESLSRMGYGAGFYDRYLEAHNDLVTMGVSSERLIRPFGEIPTEPHDKKLDYVVTEERLIKRRFDRDGFIDYINSKHRNPGVTGIEAASLLMEELSHPEKRLKFIHVTGTNGKGSCCSFLREILVLNGEKVGFFTSPHLKDFEERIQIDHEMINDDDLLRLGEAVNDKDELIRVKGGFTASMFDYSFAIAMLYFKEQNVDKVILEVGLGGLNDATNVIPPAEVSVIMPISIEHTAQLGKTLEEIALHKAGILKKGTKAVFAPQKPEAFAVLKQACKDRKIPFVACEKPAEEGVYQRVNAMCAYEAARLLNIDESIIAKGLSMAKWPGRMDVLSDDPFIMVDGAHNPDGAFALRESLKSLFPGEKFTFIIGVMSDKDYDSLLDILSPVAEKMYACAIDYERALSREELKKSMTRIVGADNTGVFEKIEDAFSFMHSKKGTKEKFILCGSLYFVGEVLKCGLR